jgi:hypothetical protein
MKRLAWQVLPPLLLLLLVFVPVDVITVIAWLGGAFAAVFSLLRLAKLLLAQLRSKRPDWSGALRPALTVVLFVVAAAIAREKIGEETAAADAFARAVAREVQAACTRDSRCPAAPAGWIADEGTRRARKVVGRIPLRYDVDRDAMTFRVSVRHAMESGLDINGGVGKELREQRVIR